jgi:hypothetical protein
LRKSAETACAGPPFTDGIPAHDHLGDILAILGAEQFQHCFVAWVAALTGALEGAIASDGGFLQPATSVAVECVGL